ncbi:MAG: Hsp20/alpha crystallin family protein [Candidatus Krumholzibacteriia bacterium]
MMTGLIPFRRLDSLFDGLFDPRADANGYDDACAQVLPRADILEGEREFRITMELPGVSREDLAIEIEGQTLTVTARRQSPPPEGFKLLHGERSEKAEFRRTFTLGRGVDPARVEARLEQGVLHLTLGKTEQMLPRKIEVR